MKIGITGSREGMSPNQEIEFVQSLEMVQDFEEFHHGDCVGADAKAHDIVRAFFPHVKIVVHPPIKTYMRAFKEGDEFREPDDYIQRDQNIVDEVDFLFATPLHDDEDRSGTWTTVRHARRSKTPFLVLKR